MRVVKVPDDLASQLDQAQREAQLAFGSPDVFLEKFIMRPRHIEVQLLGDHHGNLVHLLRAALHCPTRGIRELWSRSRTPFNLEHRALHE